MCVCVCVCMVEKFVAEILRLFTYLLRQVTQARGPVFLYPTSQQCEYTTRVLYFKFVTKMSRRFHTALILEISDYDDPLEEKGKL